MSESAFLKEQRESFLASHPETDGWKVYECSARFQYESSIRYLMDFFRDSCPQALKKRLTANEVRTEDMQGLPGKSHVVEPGSEWDVRKDLDIYDWNGTVEIDWKGQPIHYWKTVFRVGGGRLSHVAFVAAKSNVALRELHKALDEYGEARDARRGKHILVVNGEDIPVPAVPWSDVLLPDGWASEIRGNVEAFFKPETKDRYRELEIPYKRGFIFAGPPGCGKTMTLKALAYSTEATFVVLQVRAGVDEDDLERAFYLANKHAPAVVIFEDLDRLVRSKNIAVSHFLNVMDGLRVMEGILVIATSNSPERLDPALLHRPSRFDRIWRFSFPNREQRLALLLRKGRRYFSEQALTQVASESNGFSMAYVQEIILNALLHSAHDGKPPADDYIFTSLATLKNQRKTASKPDEEIAERESIGFGVPARRDPWRRDLRRLEEGLDDGDDDDCCDDDQE